MSTLSKIGAEVLAMLLPASCVGCGKILDPHVECFCIECRANMPTTNFHMDCDNPMAVKLRAQCAVVENAAAQYYYTYGGNWRTVIHNIKYRGMWYAAYRIGYIYGCELKESELYQDVDLVVPIPLHFTRMLRRRYNQSELIASGIAKALGVTVDRRTVVRHRNNKSQVTRTKMERWENVEGIFSVKRPAKFDRKHILLVDDVFTTGATIISCIEAISAAAPTCRISVATLAVSRNVVNKHIA